MRINELWDEARSLIWAYPRFVCGSEQPLPKGEIPVFVFHTIEPARFAAQLKYLAENGYRTISLEVFNGLLSGRLRPHGGEVLLTIDDARSSMWRHGFALLKQYNCHATVFAITGWTERGGGLEVAEDPQDQKVCNWDQLRAMRASGLVDVESHSHLHRRLFVAQKLLGLVESTSNHSASDAVFSPYLTPDMDPLKLPAGYFLGYPLFATQPLLGAPAALKVPREAIALATMQGQGFRELAREIARMRFRPYTEAEIEQAISEDLEASQAALRWELRDSQAGRDLCLPFTAGSEATTRIASSLGFRSIFWGTSRARRTNLVGSDPLTVVRLKNDFIWRLAGRNRRSLVGVYAEKLTRRAAGISPY